MPSRPKPPIQRHPFIRVILVVWLVIGIIVFIGLLHYTAIPKSYIQTQASVTSIYTNSNGTAKNAEATYQDQQGVTYTVKVTVPTTSPAGDLVTIYYDPMHPNLTKQKLPATGWLGAATALILSPLIVLAIVFIAGKKNIGQ